MTDWDIIRLIGSLIVLTLIIFDWITIRRLRKRVAALQRKIVDLERWTGS